MSNPKPSYKLIVSKVQGKELEKLTLSPKVYPVLDLFKSYAKAYQFSQDIAHAKTLQMMHGGGALATTLEGRMKVFFN